MTQRKWASLHNHTVYSIKDAIATPHDYIKRLHEWNDIHGEYFIGFVCTEHGYFNSPVKAYNAFNDKNINGKIIKPVYGVELYHSVENTKVADKKERYHLPLLAKTQEGLTNLYEIASYAGLNAIVTGIKTYPRADIEFLKSHGKGIIALSGCVGGYIPQLILNGKYNEAKEAIKIFKEIFDDFYLEIQPMEFAEQMIINKEFLKLSRETNTDLVITCDAHYVYKEDRIAHNILCEVSYNKKKKTKDEFNENDLETNNAGFSDYAHFRTPDEIQKYCIDNNIPLSAMDNTVKIWEECNVELRPCDEKGLMPSFKVPNGYTDDTYLEKVSHLGLFERIKEQGHINVSERVSRLRYELDVIKMQGFSSYFLIVWAWVIFCRLNNILIGPGRGSAAGSLLAYSLRITNCDPIRHGLIFERFLNPERKEFPDIDSDIETARRSEGVSYFIDTYGQDYVSQIITYSNYKLKSLIKAIVSAFYGSRENYSDIVKEINNFTTSIPLTIGDKEVTYQLIIDVSENPNKYDFTDNEYTKLRKIKDDLDILIEKYPEIKTGLEKLKNVISGTGTHAGGVVISSKKLTSNVPMIKSTGAAVLPMVQIDMSDMDFYGLLKLDCLGLNSLSQIHDALDLCGIPLTWLDEEDYSDEKVFKHLRSGFTTDVFQMASYSASNMIKTFQVTDIEGLIAVNACNRPGPLTKLEELNGKSIVEIYGEVANGHKSIEKLHPNIDPIFENTNGCLIYQEQCMKLGQTMCDYTLGSADSRIRKTIGKKKVDKIPEIKNEFIYGKKSIFDKDGKVIGKSEENSDYCKGAIPLNYEEDLALKLFAIIESMAKYCFNKSHSAAYGTLAYKTAYLSLYHPVEYAIGCINHTSTPEKIKETLDACRKRNISLLPPNINKSLKGHSKEIIDDMPNIRFGLSKVKDVGDTAVDEIINVRKIHGEFKSFDDFLEAMANVEYKKQFATPKISQKKITRKDKITKETIIEYKEVTTYPNKTNKRNIVALILAGAFDEFMPNRHKLFNYYVSEIKKDDKTPKKEVKEYKKKQMLEYELAYLSTYVSAHPLDALPYVNMNECMDGDKVKFGAIVIKRDKERTTKTNNKFSSAYVELKDGKRIGVQLFGKAHEKFYTILKKDKVYTFEGFYNSKFNNINCTNIRQIISKSELKKMKEEQNAEVEEVNNTKETSNELPLPDEIKTFGQIDFQELYE